MKTWGRFTRTCKGSIFTHLMKMFNVSRMRVCVCVKTENVWSARIEAKYSWCETWPLDPSHIHELSDIICCDRWRLTSLSCPPSWMILVYTVILPLRSVFSRDFCPVSSTIPPTSLFLSSILGWKFSRISTLFLRHHSTQAFLGVLQLSDKSWMKLWVGKTTDTSVPAWLTYWGNKKDFRLRVFKKTALLR